MKKSYRILSLLTALVMLIGIFQTAAFATDGTELTVQSAADWSALSSKMSATNGKYVIKLMADLENVSGLTVNDAKTVTLIGNGHTISLGYKNFISIADNAVFILGDTTNPSNTLDLTRVNSNDDPGVLCISNNAIVNMYDGVTIRDAKNNNYLGGGVTIGAQSSNTCNAVFHMYGGTIKNCGVNDGGVCYGGGVAATNGGTFIMDGGTIDNCYAITTYNSDRYESGGDVSQSVSGVGGGVFVSGGGKFIMNGGTIENCTASTDGGGVGVIPSLNSIYLHNAYGYMDSVFHMTGGTISGCKAGLVGGGIAVLGTYVYYAALCAANPADEPANNPLIDISGGKIIGNDANWGAGIFLYKIRNPIQIHNMIISENYAYSGGGINIRSYWTQADIADCVISDNLADTYGAGICIEGNEQNGTPLTTTMKNCTVTGNRSGEIGAGVYYDAKSKLQISGSNFIQNNLYFEKGIWNDTETAFRDASEGKLNNLNIYDETHPVYIGGDLTGSKIGISDPKLWQDGMTDADAAAISANYLTDGYNATNPEKPNNNPRKYFTSDHMTWVPDYGAQTEAIYEDQLQTTTTKVTYYGSQTLSFAKGNNGTAYSVYYDTATNTLTSTTTNEKVSPAWDANNGHVVLYYYSSTARANYWLCDLPAYTSSGTTVIPFENIPTSINIDSSGVAGATGFRFTNLSTNSAKTVNKTVTTNTPVEIVPASDYSSEVRLVRGWQVTYDPNGGEGDRYMESYLPNETVTVNANNYILKGKAFIGWNTAPDGSGVWYQPGSTFEITADLLLYAQWVSGFVLTKDFVIAEGYDGEGTNIPNIKDKVTADPTFTITPYASFNRLVGKDANDIPAFAQESYTIPVSTGTNSLLIEHPEFTMDYGIGDYWYAITENEFSVAGLGKDQTRYLHIQVTWADETRESVIVESISLHATAPDANGNYQNVEDDKTTGFTNTYGAGDLRITKDVKGNLADPNVFFAVTVQFTAPAGKTVMGDITYVGGYQAANAESAYTAEAPGVIAKNWTGTKEVTVYLKDDASVTFTNIPDGVTYTVTESDYTADGYKASYAISDQEADDSANENNATGSISDSLDEVTITNRKDATIDVGLILESLPFVLLAAGIVCFGVVMTVKRRKRTEEELSF